MSAQPDSYTILIIPDVILRLAGHEETGQLSLQSTETTLGIVSFESLLSFLSNLNTL